MTNNRGVNKEFKMKTYIWSLPTRLFHWLLVAFIVISYLSSDEESFLTIHAAFGYGVFVLILFRIIWGFIGPKYSKFSDFVLDFKEAKEFALNIFNPKKEYAGHNPAASFVMLGIIIVTLLVTISGVLTYGIQEGRGVFAFLNNSFFKEMELLKELHEVFVNLLIILVLAHLGGVFSDYILHKEQGVLRSIFNGYKNIKAQSIKLNFFQIVVATIFLATAIAVPIITLTTNTPLTKSVYKKIDYESKNSNFVNECASCHTLYLPHLLPKSSWVKLMKPKELLNHFGDDASLDEETRADIESFLVANSSENSTKEAAFYIGQKVKNKDIIAITKTPYWKKRHENIAKEVFESKKVRSRANCKACHSDIEKGLIEDINIKIPKEDSK